MSSQPERRRHRTPSERADLLAAYHKSGLTQREFAARKGLSVSCLSIWLRKARVKGKSTVPPTFIEVPVDLSVGGSSRPTYKIGFPGGHSVEVSAGFHLDELRELCQLLRGL